MKTFLRYSIIVCILSASGAAFAEDVDIKALQERLAAQEARLRDLQSKINAGGGAAGANGNYGGNPEAIVSLNKNAMVTVGGQLNTRYYYHNAKVDSVYANPDLPAGVAQSTALDPVGGGLAGAGDGAVLGRRAKASQGDLTVSDAKVYVDVQVNDYFDAFLQMDLQSSGDLASDNAEKYYIRWKNICNSGFGVKVGRDALVFGTDYSEGQLGDYTADGDGLADVEWGSFFFDENGSLGNGGYGSRIGHNAGVLPRHAMWDIGRITQVTPYMELLDGKLLLEASFFQNPDKSGRLSNGVAENGQVYIAGGKYKSRNFGFASMSGRATYKPLEGLELSASVVNFHDRFGSSSNNAFGQNGPAAAHAAASALAKNNTNIALAFSYTPAFHPALRVWAQWIHGWNVDGLKDVDSDAVSYGAAYSFGENWTIFAQGDWLATKDKWRGFTLDPGNNVLWNQFANNDKATAWAVYGGVKYDFGYGVDLEAGWKHEEVKWRQNVGTTAADSGQRVGYRSKTLKSKSDTAYVHLGFTF